MKVCPVQVGTMLFGSQKNGSGVVPSFKSHIPHKEIKEMGDVFIQKSRGAKDRKELYIIAKSYLKDGILPIIDKNASSIETGVSDFKAEIINNVAPDIELEFDPDLMIFQDEFKHISLKSERKNFANIVKTVNDISKKWKEK